MRFGARVTAVVVLNKGQKVTLEEISDFCREKIAGYKIPKDVIFIEEEDMPRSGTGKILHRILRERYGKRHDNI